MTRTASLLIALYLRVSTEEQARKGYSLPEQREACRRKAEALAAEHRRATGGAAELKIVEFVDDFGGDIAERPVLEALRAFVRTRRPAWLVCMDPDRFSRSLKLQLIIADDIEAQQTRLAFVQQEYNPDDLMSKAFFQFRGLMSELDKAKILERTSRGKRGKIKAGKRPNGAAPYGYIHIKETDELAVYEPEARWVRRIFDWVAHENLGIHLVTRRLNQLGVPRKRQGARWYRSVVGELLRNPAYCGAMRCNRKDFTGLGSVRRLPPEKRRPLSARLRPEPDWVTVPVPAIISQEQWQQVQANLRPAARRGGRRDTGLLSMLVRCGECGGRMAYARHSGGRQYLRCQQRYADPGGGQPASPRCTNRHHRSGPVEAYVWGRLVAWLTDPALLRAYREQQRPSGPERGLAARLEQEAQALQERLEAECRLQVMTVRKQAQGQLADAAVDAVLAESSRLVTQIQAELARLGQRLAAVQAAPGTEEPGPPDQVEATRQQLDSLEPAQRRSLVLMVVDQVTVTRDGAISITLREG